MTPVENAQAALDAYDLTMAQHFGMGPDEAPADWVVYASEQSESRELRDRKRLVDRLQSAKDMLRVMPPS